MIVVEMANPKSILFWVHGISGKFPSSHCERVNTHLAAVSPLSVWICDMEVFFDNVAHANMIDVWPSKKIMFSNFSHLSQRTHKYTF